VNVKGIDAWWVSINKGLYDNQLEFEENTLYMKEWKVRGQTMQVEFNLDTATASQETEDVRE
jgi:hypothetical protein